jgi:hypothetical protein
MVDLFPDNSPNNGRGGGGGSFTPSENSRYVDTPQSEGSPGCTLEGYAAHKGLPIEHLRECKLFEIPRYGDGPAVKMQYLSERGEEVCVRFRVSLEGKPKVKTRRGDKHHLYGLWKLEEAREQGYVLLVEGESDAQTAWFHGYPALGVPGASNFRNEWSEHLEGIEKIYPVVEPDNAGEQFFEKLSGSPLKDRLYRVDLDGPKDLSELHLSESGGARERFSEHLEAALASAASYEGLSRAEAEEAARDAWRKCKDLATSANILEKFGDDLTRSGVVGNVENGKLLYLAITTRLMERKLLVNVVVKGPSSAGKSHLVDKVLGFCPEDAYHRLTAFSERVLIYDDTPIERKFLIISEADGIKGDTLTYIVRSLLSEGEIDYTTVVKDGDGLKPLHIHRDGPTGLITTTTRLRIHGENETRVFSIQIDDSPELTAQIFEALADEDFRPPDLEEWKAFQTWLASGETRVTIPFGMALAKKIPPKAVRMRRDFGQLLNLIRANALLHRATRERDAEEGRIVATLEDYRTVRELVAKTLSEGVEAAVPAIVRETVGAVSELLEEPDKHTVTIKDLQRKLRLDYSPAYRRVRMALDGGYLENREERERRPAQLVLGDPLPEDEEILPSVEALIEEGVSTYLRFPGGVKDLPLRKTTTRVWTFRVSVEELLCRIRQAGITLTCPSGEDRLNAKPTAALTPELIEGIREHKVEIIETLRRHEQRSKAELFRRAVLWLEGKGGEDTVMRAFGDPEPLNTIWHLELPEFKAALRKMANGALREQEKPTEVEQLGLPY